MPIYDTSTLGTASNLITFNDDSGDPFYRMLRRGLTRREIDEFDIKLPEGTGDADFQSYIGKTYLVLEGTMYPNTETSFDTGRKALRKLGSLDVSQDDAAADDGYVPYKWSENDGHDKQLMVKVMYADVPEDSRRGLKQPFRLLCKIKYPVILSQTAATASIGDSDATTTSSSPLPFVLPVVLGKTTYSSNGSINNAGDMDTFPASMTITGPVNRPKITNSTTGEYIEVDVNLLTTGDTLIISYDADSLDITQAGVSKLSNLTSGSTLFKLVPGTNSLTLTGSSVGSGANAQISAYHAWPLS